MAIFIGQRPEAAFTRVPNSWARDPKLPLKAKGLLTYLLSHEDGYRLTVEQVVAETLDGKSAVYASIKTLIEHGYLRREQGRNVGGKVGEVHYYVRDAPDQTASSFTASGKPESGHDQGKQQEPAGQTASRFPASGSSASGKSTTKKTRVKKTKVLEDQNTISLSGSAPEAAADDTAEPEFERETVDASHEEPKSNPVYLMLIKHGCPADRVEQVKNRIDVLKNVNGDGWYFTANSNHSLKLAVDEALQDLTETKRESNGKPPWCGHCDERTRQRTTEWMENISISRCPDCHPLTVVNEQPRTSERPAGFTPSTGAARARQALAVADSLDRQFGHGAYAPGVICSPADQRVAEGQILHDHYKRLEGEL